MKTKPFTLVVCPTYYNVVALPKDHKTFYCSTCDAIHTIEKCYKLGLKKIEETGEEIWIGVKED